MRWLFAVLLVIQAHFAASYLLPLDKQSQGEFGGLLRWLWPWSDGDSGPLGKVAVASDSPLAGIWLAIGAGVLLFMAALASLGLWVPFGWCRALAVAGAGLSIVLMLAFFGSTKLLPIALAALLIVAVLRGWAPRPSV